MSDVSSSDLQVRLHGRFLRVATAIVVVLVASVLMQAVVAFIIAFIPKLAGDNFTLVNDWLVSSPFANFLQMLLFETLAVGAVVWFVRRKKVSFLQLTGLRKPEFIDLSYAVIGFLVYLVMFAIIMFVTQHITAFNMDERQVLGFEPGVGGLGLVLAFMTLVILPPIAEETIFRGFLYGSLRTNKVRAMVAIALTSLLFGGLHLFGGKDKLLWIAFLDTTVLSVLLCVLRELRGSIWAGIGVHTIKNCLVFINLFIIAVR